MYYKYSPSDLGPRVEYTPEEVEYRAEALVFKTRGPKLEGEFVCNFPRAGFVFSMNTAIRLNTACKTKYSRAKVIKNGLETFSRKKLGFIYRISEREST